MAHWSDLFSRFLRERYPEGLGAEPFRERIDWVGPLHRTARELLDPASLEAMPPQEIYRRLAALGVPQCPLRIVKLGKANDAPAIVDALRRLLAAPGDFEEKFRAAKIPQAGVVTCAEILGVVKPQRFVIRNAALTRALPAVAPLYGRKALAELPYEAFLDLCRELAKILESALAPAGLEAWAREHRFLLLYAVLVDKA